MEESNALRTLKRKREEIEGTILRYEELAERARADLMHVNAVIAVFEGGGLPHHATPYMHLRSCFKYGEITSFCMAALKQEGPLDTRELALRLCRTKGLNEADQLLRRALVYKVGQILSKQVLRGTLEKAPGLRAGVKVWRATAIP
jgi:hypothetical protein